MAAGQDNPQSGVKVHTGRDRRVTDLVDAHFNNSILNKSGKALVQDPFRSLTSEILGLGAPSPLYVGKVVYSLPYVHWYKVQLNRGGGIVAACATVHGSLVPLGVRPTGLLPPGSRVIVYMADDLPWGTILGVVPPQQNDPSLTVPDWISQGGQTGIKREPAYSTPFDNFFREGGVRNFSGNRPIDGTVFDWGAMAETGVGLHVDSFQAYLRVNEACGLFLNYFDSFTSLRGINLDIWSYAYELTTRDDEGENRLIIHHPVYPWEAMGAYVSGQTLHQEYSDQDVQFSKPYGKYDLPEEQLDRQPINRFTTYGGYIGQGWHQQMMVPGRDSGFNRYQDKDIPDQGVWEQFVALDGSYVMRSAKSVTIGKRLLIPVPKEIELPEDKQGDDKEEDNYKFSGKFGGGTEHKVGDVLVEGDDAHLLKVAAVLDLMAHEYNWKGLHPFHYHERDFKTFQESELLNQKGGFSRVQDVVNFGELASRMYLTPPTARSMKVDDRYGDVEYFQRESFIKLLDDGGVVIGDGYGAQITMTGGHIRLDCPGDVQLFPGRNIVALGGDDIILRAQNSVDVTAGNKDIRIKAENNMQLLSANSGSGTMLIETKAQGFSGDFQNKVGEEVSGAGIMLRAKNGGIAYWAQEHYMRTGGDELGKGPIVFDADRGNREIVMKGNCVALPTSSFSIFVGPSDESCNVQKAYTFSNSGAVLGGSTCLDGNLLVTEGAAINNSLAVDGSVVITGNYAAGSVQTIIPEIDGDTFRTIREAHRRCTKAHEDLKDSGESLCEALFANNYYQDQRPGDDALIRDAEFSYRDDNAQEQYNTQQFMLVESRWHQMARLGMGSGGRNWAEPPVSYQGQEQLPWPGKKKWEDEPTMLQLKELTMYDTGTSSKNRPEPYENAELSELEPVTPSDSFKVIV